jgi:hypothetical protein
LVRILESSTKSIISKEGLERLVGYLVNLSRIMFSLEVQ